MKVVLFIDSLTSGGAQRQLVWLALLLSRKRHQVVVLTYYPINFFKSDLLSREGVHVYCLDGWSGQFGRLFAVRRFLSEQRPDVVAAFLYIPCFLAELSRLLPGSRYRLIASERNTDTDSPSLNGWVRLGTHLLAHAVVPNSHAQSDFLFKYAPWLWRKISVISNCLDLDVFQPRASRTDETRDGNPLEIVMIGRYEAQKNGLQLIEGLAEYFRIREDLPDIRISWFGNDPNPASGLYDAMIERIDALSLGGKFILNSAVSDVVSVYHDADALCIASLYEGCANVVCEALACGLPIIATRAGDNERMVEDGVTGVVVEGFDAKGIADGLVRFAKLEPEQRSALARGARDRAESLLSQERFVGQWVRVLTS